MISTQAQRMQTLQDIHPYSRLVPNVDNLSQLPDTSFSNGTHRLGNYLQADY